MDYNILVNVKTKAPLNTNYTLKQGDYGQKFVITAEDYDVVGTTASLILRKSDGNVVERSLTLDNEAYTYKLDSQDTSQPGKVIADIKYYKSGVRDSSASFTFDITGDSIGTLVTSKTYSDALEQALASCKQAIQDIENALLAELNIYNGYDKTTAGYAADVRQLNESIVGTYAEMIKERIGNLSSLSTAAKSSLVGAINELKDKNDTVNNNLLNVISEPTLKHGTNINCKYCIKAGWCSLHIEFTTTDVFNGTLIEGIPTSSIPKHFSSPSWGGLQNAISGFTSGNTLYATITQAGTFAFNIEYPIA